MSPGTPQFEVDRFEHVAAARGRRCCALRAAGALTLASACRRRSSWSTTVAARTACKRCPDPTTRPRWPPPQAPEWRTAFSAPADLVTGERVVFALEAGTAGARRPAANRAPVT